MPCRPYSGMRILTHSVSDATGSSSRGAREGVLALREKSLTPPLSRSHPSGRSLSGCAFAAHGRGRNAKMHWRPPGRRNSETPCLPNRIPKNRFRSIVTTQGMAPYAPHRSLSDFIFHISYFIFHIFPSMPPRLLLRPVVPALIAWAGVLLAAFLVVDMFLMPWAAG